MKSPNRTHSREKFFKYMDADRALTVLRNRTLRWSSPIHFNDPFDVPRELSHGISPKELLMATARGLADLIANPPDDTTHLNPDIQGWLKLVKLGIPDELRSELISGLNNFDESEAPDGQTLDALREFWRNLIPTYRILCLTESPYHIAMWYHYANKYQGVVLEFNCIDALDSAWLMARPVQYPEKKPAIYTAEGLARILTMNTDQGVRALMDSAAFTKSPDWSYEKEWRVTSFMDEGETETYSYYPFHPQEISAVYFGPMISDQSRQELLGLLGDYPDVKKWDVSIGMSREFIVSPVGG